MQTQAEQQSLENAPYYIRWSPDSTRFAVELKLDLVARITAEISEAGKLGIEVGGVLIGSFPEGRVPILRIEDFEIIPRGPEDGPIFMLDPVQHERFAGARWRAKTRNKVAVGFFRSHVRPGPLRPSLADRSLLSGGLSERVYALLLIQAREPRTAALFIAENGQLPEEPSVREFRFDEAEFKALPEIEPETIDQEKKLQAQPGAGHPWLKPLVIPLVIAIAVLALLWWLSRKPALLQWLRPAPNQLELAVNERDHLLRISWNNNARELNRASGATLLIADGTNSQEIKLGPDELKLGVVEYQPNTRHVQVRMSVSTPRSTRPVGSVEWPNGQASASER